MIDLNAYIGNWPFHKLEFNTPAKLLQLMDRSGIKQAAVSPLEAVFYRNAQEANEFLAQQLQNYSDRLIQLSVINPAYVGWEHDFKACVTKFRTRGIKLFPQYHNYECDSTALKSLLDLCAQFKIPIFLPIQIEDARQRHWMDTKKDLGFRDLALIINSQPNNSYVIQNANWQIINVLTAALPLTKYNYYFDLNFLFGPIMDDMDKVVKRVGSTHLVLGSGIPFRYPETNIMKIKYCLENEAEQKQIFEINPTKIINR